MLPGKIRVCKVETRPDALPLLDAGQVNVAVFEYAPVASPAWCQLLFCNSHLAKIVSTCHSLFDLLPRRPFGDRYPIALAEDLEIFPGGCYFQEVVGTLEFLFTWRLEQVSF